MGNVAKPETEDGVGLIRLERLRQIRECNWDDERHKPGVLSEQALFVLKPGVGNLDPWQIKAKHPDRLEQLIIAGALIAAEIDHMRSCGNGSYASSDPIPEGITYNEEHDNFYQDVSRNGMGTAFYEKWKHRRSEFPQREVSR